MPSRKLEAFTYPFYHTQSGDWKSRYGSQGTESTGQRRHRVGATLEGFLEDVGYGRVRGFTRSGGEKGGKLGLVIQIRNCPSKDRALCGP